MEICAILKAQTDAAAASSKTWKSWIPKAAACTLLIRYIREIFKIATFSRLSGIMKIDIYQMTRNFLLGQNRLFLGLFVLVILVCPNSLNFRFVNVLFKKKLQRDVWKMKQFESIIEILCPVLLRSPSTQCPVIKLLQVAGSITGCVSLQLDHNQAATLPTGEILSGKKKHPENMKKNRGSRLEVTCLPAK